LGLDLNVSIIIPVLNEYSALLKLLPSLLARCENDQLELIVCDGGSSDLTHPYIRQLQIESVHIKWLPCDLGRAKQMNAGAKIAKHECLLFLHADTQLPKQWPNLIAGKVWGRFDVRLSGRHLMLRVVEKMMNWRSCITQVATGDQAIFVQKKVFQSIGGFPDLAIMEDIAVSKILRQHTPIYCVKTPLLTSSRRWDNNGIFKTIVLMWRLRGAYFLGVSPSRLAKQYYPKYGRRRLDAVVQVFSKQPILGYVKTRLIPHVGEQTATDIHRFLLKHTLTVVNQSNTVNELWVAQENQHQLDKKDEFFCHPTHAQQGADLGERMAYALIKGLSTYKKVVLIGSDCLDLTAEHLNLSIKTLDDYDVVLTPVEDGGFISIACSVFDVRMFDDVAWGTDRALADVLNNIKALAMTYLLLKPVRDIDTFDDVSNYPELLKLIH